MKITKNKLMKLLKSEVMTVIFTKVDGTEREMICTLKDSYLPENFSEGNTRKKNKNVLSVWDLDVNDWRSFRIDSVKKCSVSNQYELNFNK